MTIDGPGGTGKSTVSRKLAERLGLPHLDTGAFYRGATLAVLREGSALDDPTAIEEAVAEVELVRENGRMHLNGDDVEQEIRGDAVTGAVSAVSAVPSVRQKLVQLQRDWVASRGGHGVVEGRDIGSVVFPEANVKIFLDARPEVRASRRAAQSQESTEDVLADLRRRDHLDSTRAASPMSIPEDAVVVDTSDMTIEQVVDKLVSIVRSMS